MRKPDGKYNHPSKCDRYVLCMHKKPHVFMCQRNHHFDPMTRRCRMKDQVMCLRQVGETIFAPKGKNFVSLAYFAF